MGAAAQPVRVPHQDGLLPTGDQLPSVRTLAAEAAINYNTVSKVYVNLESDGYVESVRGRGVFVRDIGGKAETCALSPTLRSRAASGAVWALGMTIDEVTLRMMDVTTV